MTPDRYSFGGRLALFLVVVAIGTALDLGTKSWMFAQPELRDLETWWVVPEFAGFQLTFNEGAIWGIGQGKVWLFATLSVVFAVAIPVWLFCLGAAADRSLTVLLGCVMAGVLGNLYDRLGLHGDIWLYPPERIGEPAYAVRDWILLQWNAQYRWPNFNIADALLVVSAIILAFKTLFEKPEKQSDDTSIEASSAAVEQSAGKSGKQVD